MTGGSRKKNLNDWAKVIEKLKAKQLKIVALPPAPAATRWRGASWASSGTCRKRD